MALPHDYSINSQKIIQTFTGVKMCLTSRLNAARWQKKSFERKLLLPAKQLHCGCILNVCFISPFLEIPVREKSNLNSKEKGKANEGQQALKCMFVFRFVFFLKHFQAEKRKCIFPRFLDIMPIPILQNVKSVECLSKNSA